MADQPTTEDCERLNELAKRIADWSRKTDEWVKSAGSADGQAV